MHTTLCVTVAWFTDNESLARAGNAGAKNRSAAAKATARNDIFLGILKSLLVRGRRSRFFFCFLLLPKFERDLFLIGHCDLSRPDGTVAEGAGQFVRG